MSEQDKMETTDTAREPESSVRGLGSKVQMPFWSDDFDMDLPKVFPDALRLLGDLADVEITTCGIPCARTGRLNHPTVWNTCDGCAAFFGFGNPGRDTGFYFSGYGATEITCTAWEAFRDCWAHHFLMIVDRQSIWNSHALCDAFDAIMFNQRGWGKTRMTVPEARRKVMKSYAAAVRKFGEIVNTRIAAGRTVKS